MDLFMNAPSISAVFGNSLGIGDVTPIVLPPVTLAPFNLGLPFG
jgi:hypothetical protein